jgi:hypothetical protein
MTTLCALAIALSLSPAQAPPKLVADADLRELSTYTLTMENVNKFARVQKALIEVAKQDPRYAEEMKLKAELEALRKKDETTEADDKRMETIQARLETLESQDNNVGPNMNNAKNLDEMAASVQAFPPLMAVLRKEGLTAREYSKFMLAMLQAGFAAGLQKAGLLKTTPEGVNPANIKFVLEHEEELKKLQGGGGMQ